MTAEPHPEVVLPSADPRWWWGCSHPERSSDEWTLWYDECEACLMSLVAADRAGEVPEGVRWIDGEQIGTGVAGIVEDLIAAGREVPRWLLAHVEAS